MSEHRDDRKPEEGRPKYEPPVLVELGALAKGAGGGNCTIGTSPSGTPCLAGVSAQATCILGSVVV